MKKLYITPAMELWNVDCSTFLDVTSEIQVKPTTPTNDTKPNEARFRMEIEEEELDDLW